MRVCTFLFLFAGPQLAESRADKHVSKALTETFLSKAEAKRMKSRSWSGANHRGTPTHYKSSGCWHATKVHDEIAYDGYHAMSVEECFAFCSMKEQRVNYFGLTEGTECWCGSIWDGQKLEDNKCDTKCDGNDLQTCGGIDATNVFVMFDCTEATDQERAEELASKNAELISSYGSFTEQTCGGAEGNNAEINRADTLIGSVDDCKLACWQGTGAETCHGFTYDEDQTRCSFHKDVLDGPVQTKVRTTCYFKMG